DVVIQPAFKKGIGLAVLGAKRGGGPVHGGGGGGRADVGEDGVSGLLVPAGDADALRRAAERLFANAAERERLGRAGRRRALESFGVERMVDAHLAIYRRLLDGRETASEDPLARAAAQHVPAADSARGSPR